MSEAPRYPVKPQIREQARVNSDQYLDMYQQSIINPEGFWRQHGQCIHWFQPYSKVRKVSFDEHHVNIKWSLYTTVSH